MSFAARLRAASLVMLVLVCFGGVAAAEGDRLDLDRWHEEFWQQSGAEPEEPVPRRWKLGLYPGLSGVLGAPNLVSYQGSAYLSLSDSRSFSLFVGYGREWGSRADADIYTLGWGSVRSLPVVTRQRGFYGKFLRYRRWDNENHGLHHGLSLGTESGVGYLSLTVELGAARSNRNHWMLTAQIAIKIALPVLISL